MSNKIQKRHFDSITDCGQFLTDNWHLWEQGRQSGDSWNDLLSHDECKAILNNGGHHEPSAERMKQAALDMSKVPAGDLDLPMMTASFYGHRANVGAHLAGSPMSMVRFEPQPQPNKSVKMLVSVGGSCMVGHDILMNRGAAILGTIDALQTEGYAVELTVGFFSRQGPYQYHATVKVKDFGDTWNPAAIAFMLAEPSFFRRSLFAVCNIDQVMDSDSPAEHLGGSLGQPIKKTDNTEFDIEFESLHGADGWTLDNAVPKAMNKVYAWLERNKAGEVA